MKIAIPALFLISVCCTSAIDINVAIITNLPVLDEPGVEIALKHIRESEILKDHRIVSKYYQVSTHFLKQLL